MLRFAVVFVAATAVAMVSAMPADRDASASVLDAASEVVVGAEVSLAEALASARDGLMAWWGPSQSTVDELNEADADVDAEAEADSDEQTPRLSGINAAAERLFRDGVDVHDLSPSRFASVGVSAELSAAVSSRLLLQSERRADAAERHRLSLLGDNNDGLELIVPTCLAMTQEMTRYRTAHDTFPSQSQASPAILKAVPGATAEVIEALWTIVQYRVGYRGWRTACEQKSLVLALRAAARTARPVGGALSDFAMGLEEEYSDVHMNPDTEDVSGLAVSGNVPAPREAPFVKICPDHTRAPPGYPGYLYGVIEVATGPVPISWKARELHREIVARWAAPLYRGDGEVGTRESEGLPSTLLQLTNRFNRELPSHLQSYRMPLSGLRRDHNSFAITRYPNPNLPINSIQVNFEASVCSLFSNDQFLELSRGPAQRDLWRSAREATEVLFTTLGLPGVTMDELNALPSHQLCELKGLFTLVFMHGSYWGASLGVDGVKPQISIHPYGGTPKNYFSVMVKTNVRDVVDRLPFPASDVLQTVYTKLAAAEENANAFVLGLHQLWINAITDNKHPRVAVYAGPLRNLRSGDVIEPERPFLAEDGRYFHHVVRGLGARPYANPGSSSPIGDRAPPASIYRDPANPECQQIVVVCEARFQDEPLNRAMTEQLAPVPGTAKKGTSRLVHSQRLLQGLKKAVDSYTPQSEPIPEPSRRFEWPRA